jgi:tetratricopeptide (TPR) repeat protein
VSFLVIPTLGPFHVLHPRYNGVTVAELVKAHQPEKILLASYSPEELAAQSWRDQNEVSFFHVLPWAQSAKVEVEALDTQAHLRAESELFRQALRQYPKGQQVLSQVQGLEEDLKWILSSSRTPEDFTKEPVVQVLLAYHQGYAQAFGEGPATGFRQQRMERVAERLKVTRGPAVVLVDTLDYPVLLEALPPALYRLPGAHTPSESERQRSLLDRAWRLDTADDWAILLEQLQGVEGPEAIYCAAQIYLAAGQAPDAFALMEQLVGSSFAYPAYLPGYMLARYGQLADLMGQRDTALRAYKAVLGLSWAPQEAREIALAGQKTPFRPGLA